MIDLVSVLSEYENIVVYIHDGPNRLRLQEMGIVAYQIKSFVCVFDPVFILKGFLLLKNIKPDLIHTALWSANFLGRIFARMLKIPCVSVVHLGADQDGFIRNFLDMCTFFLSQEVIAVSDIVSKSLVDKKFLPANRVRTIRNCVPVESIRTEALRVNLTREQFGLDDSHIIVGSVGRFIPRKNYQFLLVAMAELIRRNPKVHLFLVGFGVQEGALRLQAERLGIGESVTFAVGVSAIGYYPLFDCFVLPSKQEGLSVALLEAMACGVAPLITGSRPHEVIDHMKMV